MSQDTAALQQASVRQYCKAVRVPVIGANFASSAEQAAWLDTRRGSRRTTLIA